MGTLGLAVVLPRVGAEMEMEEYLGGDEDGGRGRVCGGMGKEQ